MRLQGFDGLARWYRAMEFLLAGSLLQRARMQYLEGMPQPRKILLLGEGPGRLLEALLLRFPTAQCTVVDASQKMIQVATEGETSRASGHRFMIEAHARAASRGAPRLSSP